MGEEKISPIDQKVLEDAILKACKNVFPNTRGTTNNPRIEFYNKFQNEAEDHDKEFLEKYGGDLDTTLIFSALFSAVTAAFIIDVRSQIQPDYNQLSYNVTAIVANFTLGRITASQAPQFMQWTGPDPALIRVQTILFSSLAASLLAAFVAMLGKQWLSRYSGVDMHGSIVDRSRDRQRKMNGMETWRFNFVMESLPLLLQVSLLLLGCALTIYLHTIDDTVAWVIASFTAAGFLFYVIIFVACTLSYNCPFQTPLSRFVRFLAYSDDKRHRFARKSRSWYSRWFSKKQGQRATRPDPPSTANDITLDMLGPCDNPLELFGKGQDWEGFALDSNCIDWMFDRSMDESIILYITEFIPEIVWHDGIRKTPMLRLYDTLIECFDSSSGRPVVIPKFKKKAYVNAKALLHIAVHRKFVNSESDQSVFANISDRHQILGAPNQDGDPDLESTLGMIDRFFNNGQLKFEAMRWERFKFSDPHRAWMGRILLCRTSSILKDGGDLPEDVKGFVVQTLRQDPLPPSQAVLDCLFIVGLVLEIRPKIDDHQVTDKAPQIDRQIFSIYERLDGVFRNATSDAGLIKRALVAMGLIAPLSDKTADKSYRLFHTIMKAPAPLANSEDNWQAARLALNGAYRSERSMPKAGDPQDILTFLSHHFELVAGDKGPEEPIGDALRALTEAPSQATVTGLKNFDPTGASFIRGICFAFQKARPAELRRVALLFLPFIGDSFFNFKDVANNDTKGLCTDWASTVEENKPEQDPRVRRAALMVLFHMMNSSRWRPYITDKSWKLLDYFTTVPENAEPLKRCVENPDLLTSIPNQAGIVLWSTILWLRYRELNRKVQQQLEAVTKGPQRRHIDMYMKATEAELGKVEQALTKHTTWSQDPAAIALRDKTDSMREAKEVLVSLKRS